MVLTDFYAKFWAWQGFKSKFLLQFDMS